MSSLALASIESLSGNTVMSINNNGQTTFNNPTTFDAPISQPGGFTLRNKMINGGMGIDQRNVGESQTITAAAALAYTVDRWYAYCTGANVTGQQVSGSGESQYRYRFTGAASVTKIGFAQRIEAANCYDLNGGTATLSVDLANSLLTTVTWTARYANTADTFGTLASPTRTEIATGTFTVNSTVTRYSTQISIPSAATTGIEIEFSVGAQTSGTWTIGNVQLERGSAATPFEQRPIGLELSMCERYFEIRRGEAAARFTGFYSINNISSTEYRGTLLFSQKRVPPTIGFNSSFFTVNGGVFPSSYGAGNMGTRTALMFGNCSSVTIGLSSVVIGNNTASAYILMSAEL